MLNMECPSPHFTLIEPTTVDFALTKSIPDGSAPEIEAAVRDFIVSSHLPAGVDVEGFFRQTLQAIASASYGGGPGDLWLGFRGGKLVTYVLAHITNDIDGRLDYFVSQAWVRKDQRGQAWVRDAWEKIRQRAKNCFCKHFSISSSRGKDDVYCRFLGKGFHKYISVLKVEL